MFLIVDLYVSVVGHRQQWQRNRPQHNGSGHHRGPPPPEHGNGQFGGNMFPNPGYQFPPRQSGRQHPPRHPPPPCSPHPPHPPPPPPYMFPPRSQGFMGGGPPPPPPPPPFQNGPPNMGFENQSPTSGQFKQEPCGVPPGPFQGPPPGPFQNGGLETKPHGQQNLQSGMFGGMWQPPPTPPSGNLGLPGPQNMPPPMQHPPPGFPNQFPMFPPPPPPPPPENELNTQWQKQNFQQP